MNLKAVTSNAPATSLGALLAVVQAAAGLAVAFGARLSATETQSIVDLVTALAASLPIAGAIVDHALTAAKAAGSSAAAGTASKVGTTVQLPDGSSAVITAVPGG